MVGRVKLNYDEIVDKLDTKYFKGSTIGNTLQLSLF